MLANNRETQRGLWDAANELRANSGLRSAEYSVPVMGLIFLKWADHVFTQATDKLKGERESKSRSRRVIGKVDYQSIGVPYVPEPARYSSLMRLPESHDIGNVVNSAMRLIETENVDLLGVLPKTYHRFEGFVLHSLLRVFNSVSVSAEGDMFGNVYEYFLGKFEMTEGQKGGEFFTPPSIVKLIVDILEPFKGRILDPACGSGGMFVQSARFVKEHSGINSGNISLYGQEKTGLIVQLCKMNLAMRGLSGDIVEGNTYYEDAHESVGKFDFVLSNPPFNVSGVSKDKLKGKVRFPLGIPTSDNANYLWIQIFYSALNKKGRAGFVMADQACDAGYSEKEIRKKLIKTRAVDVLISVGSKFFYTVQLPCTLWFLDRRKEETSEANKILFIDARTISRTLSRRHRDFSPMQVAFIANIVHLYRKEALAKSASYFVDRDGSDSPLRDWSDLFPDGKYHDVLGLCKVVSIEEIEKQGWSLNPGRYVGYEQVEESLQEIRPRISKLKKQFDSFTQDSRDLEQKIESALSNILEEPE